MLNIEFIDDEPSSEPVRQRPKIKSLKPIFDSQRDYDLHAQITKVITRKQAFSEYSHLDFQGARETECKEKLCKFKVIGPPIPKHTVTDKRSAFANLHESDMLWEAH